jgi:hypothetical protein
VPPFLVVQGVNHLANWYTESGLSHDWAIKPTSNGWTDNETGLEWIKHFDKHTARTAKGPYWMLVLDGHESYESAEFQAYCKSNNIILLCLPAHSSHLTQPLDVGCFSVLELSYGAQIEHFIKAYINYITKVEFFIVFKAAYELLLSIQNGQAGFRGAGLIPYDPQVVISKLDINLQAVTPPRLPSEDQDPWVSQTAHNLTEALSQSTLVKGRIAHHQGSSPTPIFESVASLARGTELLAHENTLLHAVIRALRTANEALSKRRRAKKTRIRQGGVLTVEDAYDILSQTKVDEQIRRDRRSGGGVQGDGISSVRRCDTCGNTGHNSRTCQDIIIVQPLIDP